MKITLIFLITSLCSCVYCEYPTRYYPFKNNRPPPQYHPQRHGPMVPPQHMKKWQQPPGQFAKRPQNVGGNRPNRPIPMYGGQGHKNVKSQPQQPPQQLISQSQHRPTVVAPPVRSFYNQQQVANVKFPEKQQHYVQKEKPQFLSSQPIAVAQDYAYHIQSNSIPTHTTPIKQVGEKGPIHTIPAPNLSLKDKPIVVEEVRNNNNIKNNQDIIRQHQYQVTEANEPLPKGPKAFLNSNLDVQQQQMYYISEQPQTLALQTQQHQQQQLNTQAIQSTFVQQQPQLNYQILNPQLFQTEPIYIQNQETYSQNQDAYNQNQEASDKVSVEPEYHSFNYDEQAHQKAQKQQQQQQQERHLQQQQQERKQQQQQERQQQQQVQSVDPLIQTKIIQSYFDTRHDNENIVVPDAKPSEKTHIKNENNEEILGGTIRFSSLPNKEAAERLAQLQSAGKINSHLMHMNPKDIIGSDNQNMNIYVPDDEEEDIEEDMERGKEDEEGQNDKSFEDYSPEEDLTSSEEAMFGQRLIRRKH